MDGVALEGRLWHSRGQDGAPLQPYGLRLGRGLAHGRERPRGPRDRHARGPRGPRHPGAPGLKAGSGVARGAVGTPAWRVVSRCGRWARGSARRRVAGGRRGCPPPPDPPHGAVRHVLDVRSPPLGAQVLGVEELAYRRGGARRHGAPARGGPRGLAGGLHQATRATEDACGDPHTGPARVPRRRPRARIGGVARVDGHGPGRARRRGPPPPDERRLARRLGAARPNGGELLGFPRHVGGGHVLPPDWRGATPRRHGHALEGGRAACVVAGQARPRVSAGVCSQAVQPPRRGDGVVGRPPARRAAGPRRGDACAAPHQDASGPALGPPPPAPSDALGERLEDPEAGDDGATDGVQGPGEAITRALKGASPGLDPRRRPRGQMGAGARVPLGAGAAGLAPAPGGGRLAIGDGCSIQASWPNRNILGRPDHDRDVHAYRTAFTRGAQLNFQRDSRKDWGEIRLIALLLPLACQAPACSTPPRRFSRRNKRVLKAQGGVEMTGEDVRQVFEAILPQEAIDRLCRECGVIERQRKRHLGMLVRAMVISARPDRLAKHAQRNGDVTG